MSQFQATGLGLGGFRQICLIGVVIVPGTQAIGAVNGFLITLQGQIIPLTQVVGPAGGPISLNQVNGQLAIVCGFVPFRAQALQVTQVVPLGALGFGGLGATGLGALGTTGTGF